MNPVGLTVGVVRLAGGRAVDRRVVTVTSVSERGYGDWCVAVWWGHGRGEVEFSLRSGAMWGSRGSCYPWRLEPESALAIIAACREEIKQPEVTKSPSWFGNAAPLWSR